MIKPAPGAASPACVGRAEHGQAGGCGEMGIAPHPENLLTKSVCFREDQ
ncbi:MAG TPA: hypothetical protein PLU53_11230 [Bacteroidia bacterium]|nr:hypothetical protein [Bacteroidia bacterium]